MNWWLVLAFTAMMLVGIVHRDLDRRRDRRRAERRRAREREELERQRTAPRVLVEYGCGCQIVRLPRGSIDQVWCAEHSQIDPFTGDRAD